ncbi:MAG: FAD-linked oxidase C-terminal domain-containing protein, partial [Bacillota bacterium]
IPCPDLPRPLLELVSLLVGSEGTLAFLTKLALRLVPLPHGYATMLAFFSTMEQAARAVSRMVAAGMLPTALEVMGSLDIRLAEEKLHLGLPAEAEAMLLLEVDGPGPSLQRQVRLAEDIARQAGGQFIRSATDAAEREKLWLARRASSGMYGQLKPTYLTLDVTVPRHRIPEMFRKVAELAGETNLPISLLGHMGDGNLHPAVLLDDRSPEEMDRALEIGRVLVAEALRLRGTLTGEHGIGVEKLGFMEQAFSRDTLDLFAAIKRAFDPRWLLNPGKVIPVPGPNTSQQSVQPASGDRPDHSSPRGPAHHAAREQGALRELADLLGTRLLTGGQELAAFGFSGDRSPAALALPATAEELTETIAILSAYRVPVWPVGNGELASCAFSAFRGGVAVSTAGLRQVLDIALDNLTATFQAGCHPDELNRQLTSLAGESTGCAYAVDCWRLPRSTLGGEIAINACGPGRPRYGSTRDNLLGLSFVDGRGRLCRVGGQTMKNVSGYDVTRLVCGSWGTLGVVVDATVRLWPRPESEVTVALAVREPSALENLLNKLASLEGGHCLQLLSPPAGEEKWTLLIGLAGMEEDVSWCTEEVTLCAHRHGLEAGILSHEEAQQLWQEVRRRTGPAVCRHGQPDGDSRARPWAVGFLLVPPSLIAGAAGRLYGAALDRGWQVSVNASCSLGAIDFVLVPSALPSADAVTAFTEAVTGVRSGACHIGLYGCDPSLEEAFAAWRPSRIYHPAAAQLIVNLKQQLDPHGILAPTGRLLPRP